MVDVSDSLLRPDAGALWVVVVSGSKEIFWRAEPVGVWGKWGRA